MMTGPSGSNGDRLKVRVEHQARLAFVYVRQSSLKQVRGNLESQRRQYAFADEAFALHFLEDTYAAGHVAGTWGDASQRKGTHDFYNANGLEVRTWDNAERKRL